MLYRIVSIGRRARDPLIEAMDQYIERLNRYVKTEWLLVRPSHPQAEGEAVLQKLGAEDHVIALDEGGDDLGSEGLAATLGARPEPRIVFVFGGASGHAKPVLARANQRLSLAHLTLPHRLAWVVLAEQLYRAQTILGGERYHRGS